MCVWVCSFQVFYFFVLFLENCLFIMGLYVKVFRHLYGATISKMAKKTNTTEMNSTQLKKIENENEMKR